MIKRPIDGNMTISEPVKRFSASFLDELVSTHLKTEVPKYRKFQRLYEGKHKIANRRVKDNNKPNNKISNDYFGQVIDNTLGYFLGNPVIMNYTEPKEEKAELKTTEADVGVDLSNIEDTSVQDTMDKIFIDNDKDDLFMEWGKEAMIKGLSHILVYQNEESKTKIMRLSPEDVILVYKNSSTKELEYAIRLYVIDTEDTKTTTRYAEVYSADKIEIFTQVEAVAGKGKTVAGFTFLKEEPHIFNRIPIVTFYNNEENMSDLEKIESLINDYDKVLSDVSNEFEAYRNAYLLIKNMTMSNDSIQKLKDEGIVETTDNGDMKFIVKQVQTEAIENHLNRLEKNIYKFSQVPDLSDENFAGNLSGVAIRFKLFGLETKCIIKERKMEKAIRNLFRVLASPLSVLTNRLPDAVDLQVEFTRNVPNNITEIVDTVTKLDGKVDKETLLALLPFVDSPKDVLKKLEEDIRTERKTRDPYDLKNVEADSQNLFPNLNSQPQTGFTSNLGGNLQEV